MNVKQARDFFNSLSEVYDNVKISKLFKIDDELIDTKMNRFIVSEAQGRHKRDIVTDSTFIVAF